ncbi:MAG: hypothetical protein FWG39_04210 [Alphaproteobacteria bacterium]|nr:hypothetical protein [Alphaproteobacteria bacterium]
MKTKIIYISGTETFNPADIRAAFDEVRATLGLGRDVLLFGVPVEEDNVSANVAPVKEDAATEKPVAGEVIEFPAPADAPAASEKTVRKSKKAPVVAPADSANAPILSVIGIVSETPEVKERDEEQPAAAEIPAEEPAPAAESPEPMDAPARDDTPVAAVHVTEIHETVVELDADSIRGSIADIFEGLEPIDEDEPVLRNNKMSDDLPTASPQKEDADEVLSRLASEFINIQSSIKDDADTKRAPSNRISKLKNVLPFKKKESAEPSLLGDLFGWAGVAANDTADNFSMPDFFQVGNR